MDIRRHEKFEDTKTVIRSRKSKNRQYNGQQKYNGKNTKETIITHITVHNKLMIEQHEPPLNIIDKHMSSELVSYYFSTSRTRDVILVRQIPTTGHS